MHASFNASTAGRHLMQRQVAHTSSCNTQQVRHDIQNSTRQKTHLHTLYISSSSGSIAFQLVISPGSDEARLFSQWTLHWWRVNASTAREPFPYTHPINAEHEAGQGASSIFQAFVGIQLYLPGLAMRAQSTEPLNFFPHYCLFLLNKSKCITKRNYAWMWMMQLLHDA